MRKTVQTLEMDAISKQLKNLSFHPIAYGHFICRKASMEKTTHLLHYRICIVSKGVFRFGRNADSYTMQTGDTVLLTPNTLYRASSSEEGSIFYYLDFTFENNKDNKVFQDLIQCYDFRYFEQLINERQINNLVNLDHTVQINYPGTYLLVETMLMRILVVILKTLKEDNQTYVLHGKDSAQEKLIKNCIHYIDEHLHTSFSIKEMADTLNYSENYIYKCFRNVFNTSCKTFILDYRLNKAIHSLKTTHDNISDIAMAYGFSSVYHFSNAFKKKYGYSPSNLRKED